MGAEKIQRQCVAEMPTSVTASQQNLLLECTLYNFLPEHIMSTFQHWEWKQQLVQKCQHFMLTIWHTL